jgi:hypothetical protein
MRILESMLKEYDDGRSKSFFCKVAVLRDLENLSYCLDKAAHKIRAGKVKQGDVKKRAQILKGILVETALEEGVDLS